MGNSFRLPPNIILFISDDHGWRDSGAYGDPHVRTPHLDRLAREGMRFTHAFAASPLCSPSRCVIQTGLMPHRNGGHEFGDPIRRDIKTMPEYFRELGYFTAHIGKFHQGPHDRFPYDHIDRYWRKKDGEEFLAIDDHSGPVVRFLSTYDQCKPLFLVVCTHPPHTPWVKNTVYDPAEILLPPNFVDTPETRRDRADYYSDITLMDAILGDVMAAVDEKGMRENTLFVCTSDQGANWPFAKWCVYENGLRVPFVVRRPGEIAPGSTTDAMISLADLLPTCIEAAHGTLPNGIDGKSFLSVLTGERERHRPVVFGTHTGSEAGPEMSNHCPARTIRTATHRYILNLSPETTFTNHITGCKSGSYYLPHWDSWVVRARTDPRAKTIVDRYLHRPRQELYDLKIDPWEMNNLADLPEHAELVRELRRELEEWCEAQGDTDALASLAHLCEKDAAG